MGAFQGLAVPMYSDTGKTLVTLDSVGNIKAILVDGISSSGSEYAINIEVTDTTAKAVTANTGNAILVSMSSKANLNAVIGYNSGGGSEVGTSNYLLAVHGSKAPTYFLGVGATGVGVGAMATSGFYMVSHSNYRPLSWASTTLMDWILITAGTAVRYIPCFISSNVGA